MRYFPYPPHLPIKPGEVGERKRDVIPVEVIVAFNELIALNFVGQSSKIAQSDVVTLAKSKLAITNPDLTFNYDWLNVEELYRSEGWKVKYEKPEYFELHGAWFTFERGEKK